MSHHFHTCDTCQLHLALYGESFIRVGVDGIEHLNPVPTMNPQSDLRPPCIEKENPS